MFGKSPQPENAVQTTPTGVIFALTIATAQATKFGNATAAVDRTVEFVGIWRMR